MKISFYDPDEPERKDARRTNSSFTLDWVSELGWKKNPFTLKNRIAGFSHEEQEINLFFIKQRRFGTVRAATGMGKTTLLNWLSQELEARNGFVVKKIQADLIGSAMQLRVEIADTFRGLFSSGKEIGNPELLELVQKKTAKKQFVILIDDADDFTAEYSDTLSALLRLDNTQIILTAEKMPKELPARDELELEIGLRDESQNQQILSDRIEAVGGSGMHPFTDSVIKRMTDETDTIQDFLSLAHETAIHIALNKVTGDDDGDEEKVAKKSEKQAAKKTSKGVKGRERTKYDELIESLGEELTK